MEATVFPSAQGLLLSEHLNQKNFPYILLGKIMCILFHRKIPTFFTLGKKRPTVNRVSKNRKEERLVYKVECKGGRGPARRGRAHRQTMLC